MSEEPHLLVHDRKDNVGVVVVEGLEAGTEMFCRVTEDNSTFRMQVLD
ncbi:MAG: flagellar biosynthesis protein FlgA, partial [Alphaproteobacteria bacterium]|nr:flagellar biosynthesis protein FlgA [Alphaproteobacteria bacterium]MCR9074376.1 flagellar biosynthesis protein FlgA [Alphaproteobacteria bacterium]